MCNGTISATASANHYFSLDTFNLTPPHTGVRIVSVCSNGFRSHRVSVLRCTRTGLFILGIGSGSSNRVSVDPEIEIEPECGREGLVPMRPAWDELRMNRNRPISWNDRFGTDSMIGTSQSNADQPMELDLRSRRWSVSGLDRPKAITGLD